MANIFTLKSEDGKPLKLDTASDLEPHIHELRDNPEIEEVRLGGNTLGIGACRTLADILETKKDLKIFNAADIFTGRLISEIPEALSAILTALLTLPNLHTVDLSDNAFGGRLAEPLRDFYSKALPLRHLLLNNNGLGPAGGTIIADSIAALAKLKSSNLSAPPLETIVCGRNRLENGSMAAWANAYAAHKTLKSVKMVQNGIRPEGIVMLLRDGLSKCEGLQSLDLQDNTFTHTGAKALADVLPKWKGITELGVADSLLGGRGGVLLGGALQLGNTKELKKLSLQYNEIDLAGFKALKVAVVGEALPKLETLELNGNKFSEDETEVEKLRKFFSEKGVVDGLDSLSDMEEETDDEDEGEEASDNEVSEDEDEKESKEDVIAKADQAENQIIAQEKDTKVDELADLLGGTKIGA